jgi:hypothetical protein
MEDDGMSNKGKRVSNKSNKAKDDIGQEDERQPHLVRLPGFIRNEDVGLGDFVTRVTSSAGVRPCGGCQRRAAVLNRWVVFTR